MNHANINDNRTTIPSLMDLANCYHRRQKHPGHKAERMRGGLPVGCACCNIGVGTQGYIMGGGKAMSDRYVMVLLFWWFFWGVATGYIWFAP